MYRRWISDVCGAMRLGLFFFSRSLALRYMINESKWISISIYNTVVVLAIVSALFGTLDATDETVFWLAGPATIFLTTAIMLAMFVPKVQMVDSDLNSNNTNT